MSAHTLRELFVEELKDVYDAEQRITRTLPKLVEAAESEDLSSALKHHLDQTEVHVTRLERIFGLLDEKPVRKSCRAMIGLLEEGDELMREDGSAGVRDTALIAAAEKVEHYEMATYGVLRAWADRLGETEAARMLQMTLDEEERAAAKLTTIWDSMNGGVMNGGTHEGRASDARGKSSRTHSHDVMPLDEDDEDLRVDEERGESGAPGAKPSAHRTHTPQKKR